MLTKEATDKDRSLKTQLTISLKSCEEKISGERVWRNEEFFKDTKPELNLEKIYSEELTSIHKPILHFDCEKWRLGNVSSELHYRSAYCRGKSAAQNRSICL